MLSRRTLTISSLGALFAGSALARVWAAGGPAKTFEITKTQEEWKRLLDEALAKAE